MNMKVVKRLFCFNLVSVFMALSVISPQNEHIGFLGRDVTEDYGKVQRVFNALANDNLKRTVVRPVNFQVKFLVPLLFLQFSSQVSCRPADTFLLLN